MTLAITLQWRMAVPGALTLPWMYALIRGAVDGSLDSDGLQLVLVFWLLTAGPAILAGWLAS